MFIVLISFISGLNSIVFLLQAFGFIPDFVGQAKVLLAAKEKGI